MKLEWLGDERSTIEAIFLWSNHYAPRYKKPFRITNEVWLSASEIQVVEYLLENEELQLNMAGVARRLGISPSAFTAMAAKLEKMGLVEKYYHEGNRKNLIVLVTAQGPSFTANTPASSASCGRPRCWTSSPASPQNTKRCLPRRCRAWPASAPATAKPFPRAPI